MAQAGLWLAMQLSLASNSCSSSFCSSSAGLAHNEKLANTPGFHFNSASELLTSHLEFALWVLPWLSWRQLLLPDDGRGSSFTFRTAFSISLPLPFCNLRSLVCGVCLLRSFPLTPAFLGHRKVALTQTILGPGAAAPLVVGLRFYPSLSCGQGRDFRKESCSGQILLA